MDVTNNVTSLALTPDSARPCLQLRKCLPSIAAERFAVETSQARSRHESNVFQPRNGSPSRLARVVACLFLALSSAGCASVGGESTTYKLPPASTIATAHQNPQLIDLTRLATAATPSDILCSGDVIDVAITASLKENDTVRFPVRIEEDGFARLPSIGPISLAGLKMEAAEAAILDECVKQELYRSPCVTVTMKSQRMNRIVVAGAVMKPSVYDLPRGQSDLFAALSRAEGLAPGAGTHVMIRNPNLRAGAARPRVASANAHDFELAGHAVNADLPTPSETVKVDLVSTTTTDSYVYALNDGAVVYVEKRVPDPIYVLGLVSNPGQFEFPLGEDPRLLDAIALAGGVPSLVANKVSVIRRRPSPANQQIDSAPLAREETIVIRHRLANLKESSRSNIRLEPGDIVSVEPTPMTYLEDLLRGFGANFAESNPHAVPTSAKE